jgi:adenylate kinase
MKNIVLFGPPGSGKGTQASKLVEKYNLLHISTGDLFRYEMGNDTPLGLKAKEYMSKGELVPDEVTIGMLKNKVNSSPNVDGFIFDGFPRTIPQAESLDELMKELGTEISAMIALQVNDDELLQRLLKRGATSGRVDDTNPEIINNRIMVYNRETAPVLEYYAKQNKTHIIDGIGTIEVIFGKITDVINNL